MIRVCSHEISITNLDFVHSLDLISLPGGVCPHLVEVEGVQVAAGGDGARDGVAQGAASRARLHHDGSRPKFQLNVTKSSYMHVMNQLPSIVRISNWLL